MIKLNKSQYQKIVSATFPSYNGRKVNLEFTEKVHIYNLNWSDGTRYQYKFVFSNGNVASPDVPAPWDNLMENTTIDIPENVLIVRHSIFCGQDSGITIYAHPSHQKKLLPALTD